MVSTEFLNIVETLVVFAIAGAVGEGVIFILRRSGDRVDARFARTRLLHQVIRLLWIGLALLFTLSIWGVTSDVLTALAVGIIALVISLGLQSTISNMVSGMFLLQDGAIRIGDRIEHFAIKGVVVRVALRNTWVRTDDGQMAVIGNSKLADGPTLNHSLEARFEAAQHAGTAAALFSRRRSRATPPEPAVPPK